MTREGAKYTQADVLEAVKMVQKLGLSLSKASLATGVPKSTLQNRMKRKNPTDRVRKGPKPTFTPSIEDDIVSWIAGK